MTVQIVEFGPGESLDRLEPAWRQVQDAGGVSHPMYSWEWMSTWWHAFGRNRELLAFVLADDSGSVAVAPFVRRRARMNRLFTFRRLELMGTGERQQDEVYSEYVDLPAVADLPPTDAAPLADQVMALDGDYRWDDVMLFRVRPDSLACTAMSEAARRAGLSVRRLHTGLCPYVELPSSMDDYLMGLGKKRRYQTRRSLRLLEDLGELTHEKAQTLDDALAMLDELEKLHQARWEARGEHGVFASNLFEMFHREFIRRTFDLGWPELWTVRLDGEPIACRYDLRYRDRIYCYLSGMRLLEDSRIQPGIVAHYYAIEEAIGTGAKQYDFMMGEQSYKTSLSNASRELVTVRICRRGLKERARRGLVAAVCNARRTVRGAQGVLPSWLGGSEE